MSEFIFAIIGGLIGGAVGVLVMSMLTVSKRADEDAELRIAFGRGYLTGRMHEHKDMSYISLKDVKEDQWQ